MAKKNSKKSVTINYTQENERKARIADAMRQFKSGHKKDGSYLYLTQGRKRIMEVYLGDDYANSQLIRSDADRSETWVFITEELLKEKIQILADLETRGLVTAEFMPSYKLKGVIKIHEADAYDILVQLMP